MGGQSSSSQTQSSTTAPWAAAQPAIQGILGQVQGGLNNTGITGQETGAINSIENNAANMPNNSGAINGYVTSLLNGGGANNQAGAVNQNYQTYAGQTNPLASNTDYNPYDTPGFKDAIGTMTSDITNGVNGSFAAAGRDFSGANSQTLGRGLTQGLAPTIAAQYNQNVNNQQGAAGNLYNAGNTNAGILSGLQQQHLANQGQGLNAASAAPGAQNAGSNSILNAEAARRGIPVQALSLLANIGVPIGGLGSQSTGQGNTTNQASLSQQIGQLGGGFGGIFGNFGTGKAFPSIF
jgi:hypothetical protein